MTSHSPGDESRPVGRRHVDHDPHYTRELRNRVLDELSTVQGRVALANSALDPIAAKEQLRLAHSGQRLSLLQDSADWLWENEASLLSHFADGSNVDPAQIEPIVMPVRTQLDADLFRYAAMTWSVPVSAGYGRRSRFLVRDRHNGKLMAIFALGDPVIAQSARDSTIGWTTEQRNDRLYSVYDAFVLGAVEPYRQLIAGKLVALLSLSNETRDFLAQKYQGTVTGIREQTKDPTPLLITTSSALGRSSIYNRLVYRGQTMFHSVGFTRGFGHFQFSNTLFAELRDFVRDTVLEDPNSKVAATVYGSGPNWRFRVIRTALKALDIPEESLQHNVRREVFLAPTATHWDEYLRGESVEYEPFDLPAADIGEFWRERWAVGRAQRQPEFAEWSRQGMRLTTELSRALAVPGHGVGETHGRVDMGPYSVAVGVSKEEIRGRTANGVAESGTAVFHRLEGPNLELTFADVHWANGERELRGWDRHDSGAEYEALVGRLRLGIHAAERYRGMSTAEIRLLKSSADGQSSQVYKTTDAELESLLGFSMAGALDALSEAMVGTRGELLKDDGARKNQLAVVFETGDLVTPAVVWALSRALAFRLQVDPNADQPTAPVVTRRPPKIEDIRRDHYTSPAA
jgi:hypothetical protein